MTQQKALGLFTLMVASSQMSRNLNAALNQNGQTADGMWNYFLGQIAPFGVNPGDVDRTQIEPLWLEGGVLQPQFDASHYSVGVALSPPLGYEPGPCPNGVLQTDFMNRLP